MARPDRCRTPKNGALRPAAEAGEALKNGTPSIMTVLEGDKLAVVMDVLEDGEVLMIGDRIRELLRA